MSAFGKPADVAWLQDVKPGDLVCFDQGNTYGAAKVDRITDTLIIVGHHRFRKKDGQMVGGDPWHCRYLYQPTPERIEIVRRNRLAARLVGVDWHKLPTAVLKQIDNLVRQANAALEQWPTRPNDSSLKTGEQT